jgi:hypothetical protein
MKKFTIKCNSCGSTLILVSAYSIPCAIISSGVQPLPYIQCVDCGNEWNPQILDGGFVEKCTFLEQKKKLQN